MSSDEIDSSDERWPGEESNIWGNTGTTNADTNVSEINRVYSHWDRDTQDESKSKVENETDPSRRKLKSWLNKTFRIKMTDGRILIGMFVCTDADANVILGLTSEFTENGGEERVLGLVMIPGRYIVSIEIDEANQANNMACL